MGSLVSFQDSITMTFYNDQALARLRELSPKKSSLKTEENMHQRRVGEPLKVRINKSQKIRRVPRWIDSSKYLHPEKHADVAKQEENLEQEWPKQETAKEEAEAYRLHGLYASMMGKGCENDGGNSGDSMRMESSGSTRSNYSNRSLNLSDFEVE